MESEVFADYQSWLENESMPKGQKKVLLAAIQTFGQQGYDGTSTAQVAEVAGVSQATIFKYYKTKHDLLVAILDPLVAHVLPTVRDDFLTDINQQFSLEELIHFIVHDRFDFLARNVDIVKILLNQAMVDPQLSTNFSRVLNGLNGEKGISAFKTAATLFKNLSARGDVYPELNEFDLIRTVVGQILTFFMQTCVLKVPNSRSVDEQLEVIEQTILRAISPKY